MARFDPQIRTNVSPTSAGPAPTKEEFFDPTSAIKSLSGLAREEIKDYKTGQLEKEVEFEINRYKHEYLSEDEPDSEIMEALAVEGDKVIAEADKDMQHLRDAYLQGAVSKLGLNARIDLIQKQYTTSSPAFAAEFAQSAARVKGGSSSIVDIIEKARNDAAKSATSGDKWWQARAAEFGIDISDPTYQRQVQQRLEGKRAKEDKQRAVETGQWDQKAYLNTSKFTNEANDDMAEYAQLMNEAVNRNATPVELDSITSQYEARFNGQHPAGLTSPKVTTYINQIKAMRETFGKTLSNEFTATQKANQVKAMQAASQSTLLANPLINKYSAATKLMGETMAALIYKSEDGSKLVDALDSVNLAIDGQDDGNKDAPELMVRTIEQAVKDNLNREEFEFMDKAISSKLNGVRDLTDPKKISEFAASFSDPRTKEYWTKYATPQLKSDFRKTMTLGIEQALDTFSNHYTNDMKLHTTKDGNIYLSGEDTKLVRTLNNVLSATVSMSRALANVNGEDYKLIGDEIMNQLSQVDNPVKEKPEETEVSPDTDVGGA